MNQTTFEGIPDDAQKNDRAEVPAQIRATERQAPAAGKFTSAMKEIMGFAPVGLSLRFTEEQSEEANDTWGANCGPHSLAAILGKTLDEARVLLAPKFDEKFRERGYGFTNPTMMGNALARAGQTFKLTKNLRTDELCEGVNRIQWEGPWLKPGVPPIVAYGHTHWVACREGLVFCTAAPVYDFGGSQGWLTLEQWRCLISVLCHREKFAGWHVTHHYAW